MNNIVNRLKKNKAIAVFFLAEAEGEGV